MWTGGVGKGNSRIRKREKLTQPQISLVNTRRPTCTSYRGIKRTPLSTDFIHHLSEVDICKNYFSSLNEKSEDFSIKKLSLGSCCKFFERILMRNIRFVSGYLHQHATAACHHLRTSGVRPRKPDRSQLGRLRLASAEWNCSRRNSEHRCFSLHCHLRRGCHVHVRNTCHLWVRIKIIPWPLE